jgi:hypothetical protein
MSTSGIATRRLRAGKRISDVTAALSVWISALLSFGALALPTTVLAAGGTLTIAVTVGGAPSGFGATFAVSIDCLGDGKFSGTIEYPDAGSTSIDGIPDGATCTVTQGALPEAPVGFEWAAPNFPAGNAVTIAPDATSTVEISNTLMQLPNPVLLVDKSVSLAVDGPWANELTTPIGTPIWYRVALDNTGTVDLTELTVNDSAQDLLIKAGCVLPDALGAGAHVECVYADIAGGHVDPTYTSTLVNTVTVDAAEIDPISDTATVTSTGWPSDPIFALHMTNSTRWGTVTLPGESPIRARVTNEGSTITFVVSYASTDEAVHSGTLYAQWFKGLTYVPGSATSNADFRFDAYDDVHGVLAWNAATITASGSVSYKLTADAGASALGPLQLLATIVVDGLRDNSDPNLIYAVTEIQATPRPSAVLALPPTDGPATREPAESGGGFGLAILGLACLAGALGPLVRGARRRRS